ncbi:hypothetical protein [Lactobacillus delbrueckii]|uniref:hypothetical protein n=1 Tax=Lactobacillus delbrueckii TaxID=1584 RepID=UPI00216879E6|nr:hypothetical protein [Lactobacillus delbrueckii]
MVEISPAENQFKTCLVFELLAEVLEQAESRLADRAKVMMADFYDLFLGVF